MTSHLRGGQVRAYLELVRPPALCTAAADSLCAFVWVSQSAMLPFTWSEQITISILLILMSGSVYAAGMCTNDIFDRIEDQRDRAFRPIPSGRVKLDAAWCLALSLQLFALTTCGILSLFLRSWSWCPLTAVLVTILMTYLYNSLFKNQFWAPLIMGGCRLGNFWIGASLIYAMDMTSSQIHLSTPSYLSLGTLVYVTTLTALSRYEVEGGTRAKLWCGILLISATHPLWWSYLNMFNTPALPTLIAGATVFVWLLRKSLPLLVGSVQPQTVQQMVGAGIRGVVLTNIVLCIGLGSWVMSVVLLIMSILAARVGRWFYAT